MSFFESLSSGKSGTEVHLDKRRLLQRHLQGDPNAFSELVALYRAPVYSYLIRSGVQQEACDDLFQEIFIKIHNAAGTYNPKRPLNPWIFTIVANTARSYHRKRRVQKLVYEDRHLPESGGSIDGHEIAEAQETASWLETEIKRLPLAQREVVVLCLVECMSQKDVAKALEIPLSTVKTHLRRARMALAAALMRRKAKMTREVSS